MSTVIKQINNGIGTLTIDRQKSLNALNSNVLSDLREAFTSMEMNDAVGAVILTGAGDKAFIAGADIKEMADMTPSKAKEYAQNGQSLTMLIENFPKPVIAAVNGFALGGGCEFAMACHIRYASENARFGQPEVGLGLIAGFGGTQRLPRLVGKGRALEILLSGKMITAQDAFSMGLVNKVVSSAELMAECEKLAGKILKNGPVALKYTIQSVNDGLDNTIEKGLEIEADQFKNIFESEDKTEGLQAFIEKRKPDFMGR